MIINNWSVQIAAVEILFAFCDQVNLNVQYTCRKLVAVISMNLADLDKSLEQRL